MYSHNKYSEILFSFFKYAKIFGANLTEIYMGFLSGFIYPIFLDLLHELLSLLCVFIPTEMICKA